MDEDLMPNLRRVGAYAKLLANYASDDAIIDAGEKAELLFVRGLAFCATSDSDGYITDAQVARYVGAGMKDMLQRVDRLVEVGLWERRDGGYLVRSWTKIHQTSDEKGRKLKTDRERKRNPDTPPNGIRSESERNPSGIRKLAGSDSLSMNSAVVLRTTSQSRDTTEKNSCSTESSDPDRFDEFWAAYPLKRSKRAARTRWDALLKRGVDPQAIISGAKAYADEVRGTDPKFTKYPDGWLNAGRWEDEPAPAPPRPNTPWAGA